MAQVVLDRPRILAIVGELVPAAMPQHVAGNQEREFRRPILENDFALTLSWRFGPTLRPPLWS